MDTERVPGVVRPTHLTRMVRQWADDPRRNPYEGGAPTDNVRLVCEMAEDCRAAVEAALLFVEHHAGVGTPGGGMLADRLRAILAKW
jgi:hypothetical protein